MDIKSSLPKIESAIAKVSQAVRAYKYLSALKEPDKARIDVMEDHLIESLK